MGENESATGLAITIPEEVFNDLNRLEGKIKSLEASTNLASKNIVKAFQRMVSGINPLINKMGEAESLMKSMGNIDFSTGLATLGRSSSSIEKSASAIVDMANAMNRTDFSANIENAHKRLQTLIGDLKIYEEYLNTPNDANQALALEGIDKTSKEIKEIIAVIPELEKLQSVLSRNDLFQNYIDGLNGATIEARRQKSEMSQLNEYYRELEKSSARSAKEQERATAQAQKALERQRKEQEKLLAAQQKAYRETPKGAMDFAASATTYNQRAQAMKYLEAAIKNLDKTSKDYQQTLLRLSSRYKALKDEQDAVQRSMGTLQQSQHNLMDISGQLMRRLALVFSVSQVTQYVQKLAQVRGEFELQNAALAAIMQNKDEADRLFSQITQLAVQSPFQLKELVTYTKELAAYRIENEKLYDTTKMLADVSAGLGVDMSRLILAYGQVKAANYLRGTELRQFSEAGINILGELATYFSEIENRAVSVGEVFEMVSNRMVTFQDVEEIFRRITSEGGIFANMQEVQARTLAGMISNMQDSVDIMLNEIGQESDGILKNAVSLVKELMENWRTVAAIGKSILIPLTTYLALSKSIVFLNKQWINMEGRKLAIKKLLEAWTRKEALAQAGLNTAAKANPYILLASVLIGTISGIVSLIRNATEEQRRMNQTINEGAQKAMELSANFERLANIAVADSSSTEEQTTALEELNRTYGELIPSQYRNVKALKEMQGDYSAVTAAIYDKIDAQTREKLVQDALTQAGEDSGKWTDNLIGRLQKYGISADAAMVITREFQERLKNGDYSTMNEAIAGLRNIIKDFAGEAANAAIPIGALEKPANKLFKIFSSLKDTLDKISDMEFGPFRIGGGSRVYEEYSEQLKEIVATTDEYKKQLEQDGSLKFKYSVELDEAAKDAQIKAIQNFINTLRAQIDSGEISGNDVGSVLNVIEDAEKKIEEIKVSSITEDIQDLRVEFSKLYDLDFGKLSFTEKLSTEGFDEYVKKVKTNVEELETLVNKLDAAQKEGKEIPPLDLQNMLKGRSEEELRNEAKAARAFLDAIYFDYDEKAKKSGGKDPNEEKYKKWISLIKEVKREYENLLKNFDEADAQQKIVDAYTATFEGAGIGDLIGNMTFDVNGILKALKTLMERAGIEYSQLFNEAADNIETERDIEIKVANREQFQDEMDELLNNHELTVELKKLGGDENMASLLGIDWTDLDDVYAHIQKFRKDVNYGGEEDAKLYAQMLKRYQDLQLKQTRENTKKYLEYLNESKDERLKIEEDYQRRLAEIQDTQLNKKQKQQATANLTQERDRKLAEYDWEQFKGLDLYRTAFEDLERVGESTLNTLLSQLEYFASTTGQTLPTEDFRELMNALKNVRDELESRNPLQAIVDGIREYRDATEELAVANANYEAAMQTVTQDRQVQQQAQQEVSQATADYASAENAEQRRAALERLSVAEMNLVEANARLEQSEQDLKTAADKVAAAYDSQRSAQAKAIQNGQRAISQYNEMSGQVNNIINAVKELADGLGIAFDDETSAAIEGFQKGFSVLGTVMSAIIPIITAITVGGYAMQTALWPLLVIGAALGSIFAIIGAHDAKRDKIIENEKKNVEELQEQYDELHDHMENALTFEDLDNATEQTRENLEAQIESLDKAIAASLDKKKFDEDEYEDLLNQRKEAEEALRQNEIDRIQSLGGFGDEASMKDAAQDFIDSWLDAYKETGDGLDALTDKWNEYIENVIANQMRLKVMEKFLEPIMTEMDSMLNDSRLDYDEAARLRQMVEQMAPLANDALKQLAEAYGIVIDSADEGALSGLQKGIQGVTEETAQIIEALLNSMRYYVADSNLQLRNIYMILSGNEAVPNPILAELRAQTEQIRAINRLIRNVTASGHPNGGDGIKVFMN